MDHPLHEDARGVDLVGVELAGLDQLLDLGNRDPPGSGAQRVEVARGLAIDEIAVPVALPGVDEREVGDDATLEDVRVPSNSRTSLASLSTATLPSGA